MIPDTVVGLKFFIDGMSLLFTAGRIFATRRTVQTRESIAAHVCLFMTFATDLTATGIFIWIMFEEKKIIKKYNGDPALVGKEVGNPDYTKIFFIAHLFYYLSLYFLKGAYLSYYAQLFVRTQTKKRFMLYFGIGVTVLTFLVGFLSIFFWCQPLSDNWNPFTKNTNCPVLFNFRAFSLLATMNIISDIAIILVPLVVISNLRLNKREFIGLVVIFIIGGSSILASIIRFVVLGKKILALEFTWDTLHLFALISHAEVLFGIVAFSLPTFRPLLRQVVSQISYMSGRFTSGRSSSGGTSKLGSNLSHSHAPPHGTIPRGMKPKLLETSSVESQEGLTSGRYGKGGTKRSQKSISREQ